VVVHRDGERTLGGVLADHVLVKELLHLTRRGNRRKEWTCRGNATLLLLEDVLAEVGAVGADVDVARAFDHRANFTRGLAAEGAGGALLATEAAVVSAATALTTTLTPEVTTVAAAAA
jgi:hypothetical protein